MPRKFKNIVCIIFITILTVLFLLLFSSCQPNIKNVPTETELENGETGILASNNAVDFYFYYPENWVLDKNAAMISVYINDSEFLQTDLELSSGDYVNNLTKPNLSAVAFGIESGTYETVEEYWNDFVLPQNKETLPDFDLESSEDLNVNGLSAKKYTYTLSSMGIKYKQSQIIFFRKQQVYTLTYTVTENKYEKYANILDTAAETFKFK